MELKTLKDIEQEEKEGHIGVGDEESHPWSTYETIKQEAIKWVKHCPKRRRFGIECREVKLGKSRKMKCEPCMRFIDFFNLTEEELKDE